MPSSLSITQDTINQQNYCIPKPLKYSVFHLPPPKKILYKNKQNHLCIGEGRGGEWGGEIDGKKKGGRNGSGGEGKGKEGKGAEREEGKNQDLLLHTTS